MHRCVKGVRYACLLLLCLAVSPVLAQGQLDPTASSLYGVAPHTTWAATSQPSLAQQIASAPALGTEDLGSPIRSTAFEDPALIPNPDHKTYDLLLPYVPLNGRPTHIVIIDLGSGAVQNADMPAYLNFHLDVATGKLGPDGKYYMTVLNRMQQVLCVYDPARNEFKVNPVALPATLLGETHPMCIGTDGMVYLFGADPSGAATAVQINPKTGQVTDYGPIGPVHPNGCWAWAGAADARYIYLSSGKVPYYLIAFDRVTRTSKVLLQTGNVDGYLTVGMPDRYGCNGYATGLLGTGGTMQKFWLYQGQVIPMKSSTEKPPWPDPNYPTPWIALPPKPETNYAECQPDSLGNATVWYRSPEAKRRAPNPAPPGATPKQLGWRSIRYSVPTYPEVVERITELPDGRIFGCCDPYMGNFIYDPSTGQSHHLGKIGLSQYAAVPVGKYVYLSGYPNSSLYVYDTTRPWTANTLQNNLTLLPETDPSSNPRLVGYMNSVCGAHKMYTGALGADGCIYFGGIWMRDGNCGGFAWYNPANGTMNGIWELFSNYQICFITPTTDHRYIVISTRRIADPLLLKPKPIEGSLFVFDTTSHTIVRQIDPLPLISGTGLIVGVSDTRVIGWTQSLDAAGAIIKNQSVLYGVNVATGQVEFTKILPFAFTVGFGTNQQEPFDFRLGPDGMIWTFTGSTILRIDPSDADVEPFGTLSTGGRLAFLGEDLYIGSQLDLRKTAGVVPLPSLTTTPP